MSFKERSAIWIRPFVMFLREIIVFCLSLLSGFSDALISTFLESFTPIYKQQEPWHYRHRPYLPSFRSVSISCPARHTSTSIRLIAYSYVPGSSRDSVNRPWINPFSFSHLLVKTLSGKELIDRLDIGERAYLPMNDGFHGLVVKWCNVSRYTVSKHVYPSWDIDRG